MSEMIKTKSIVPNAWNKGGDEGIEEMAASLAQHGQLQAILVRPVGKKYEIIAGERRWRACVANKMPEVDCTVKEIDERSARVLTLEENMKRKRLTPFDVAREVSGLFDSGMEIDEIAAQIGHSSAFVRRRLLLRNLDLEAIQKKLDESRTINDIPLLALELLAAAPVSKREAVKSWNLSSVHTMRQYLMADELDVSKAKWSKRDDFDGLPTCAECPHRTGAEGCLFPELSEGKDLCMNPECWKAKGRELALRLKSEKTAKGQEVILIGDDFDQAQAEEDGVERPALYISAKKTDPGALLAVQYDGQDAGLLQYVRPIADLKKAKAKTEAKDPSRKLWRKIGKRIMDTIESLPGSFTPIYPSGGGAERELIEDVLRFGVEQYGVGYVFPEDAAQAMRDMLAAVGSGVWSVARTIGNDFQTVDQDRMSALAVLRVYFPSEAKEKLKEIEEGVDSTGKKRG